MYYGQIGNAVNLVMETSTNSSKKSYNDLSDEALMVYVVDSDSQAADVLVTRYQKILFGFLYRLTMNHANTDDLFQETWLRVIRYRHTFSTKKIFRSWLFQIALNCTRDFFSRHNMRTVLIEEDIPTKDNLQTQQLENQELAEKLMKNLSLPLREVMVLRYFHEMKEKEIAQILDIPLGTVKSRIHKALAYLKKHY